MRRPERSEMLDTVVVGAGQAGLALGYYLQRAGHRFVLVDAHARVGDSWRRRWDSLTLFTPRRYDALPGLAMPGDPNGHPGKDEVADYLDGYAAHFGLPVRLDSPVTSVRARPGGFTVQTPTGSFVSRNVVVAAGAFHTPFVPDFAANLAPEVVQLHSSAYQRPAQVPAGDVVVVGGGNTGVQIAEELAAHGRRVTLSAPTLGPALPQRVLGRDIFWWFDRLGTMRLAPDHPVGRRIRAQNPIIGTDVDRLLRVVRRAERVVAAQGAELLMADGARYRAEAVIWATGFRPAYPWLHVPVLDPRGVPVHRHGETAWPGLYFLGLPWQRSRGSALLGWVGRDAADLAARLGPPASRFWPGAAVTALEAGEACVTP
jgi:putative flavoprotein involved in K+ transport